MKENMEKKAVQLEYYSFRYRPVAELTAGGL
jgi:hypothetical protein